MSAWAKQSLLDLQFAQKSATNCQRSQEIFREAFLFSEELYNRGQKQLHIKFILQDVKIF